MASRRNEETGVILKIQRQTGCLLLIIGAAMLAFVLTDLFKSGPSAFGSSSRNAIGQINGENIDYVEFQQRVEERRLLYAENNPTNIPSNEQLQEEVWNILMNEKIIKTEHKALGIAVSPDEFEDVTVGKNPHPRIIQAFQNQETKVFDRNRFIQFLESDIQDDDVLKSRWLNLFEEPIKEELAGGKYDKMVKKSLFVTKLDVEVDFEEKNREINANAVSVLYETVSDSTIEVSDSKIASYIKANSEDYQQEASRSIEFAVVNVFPSSEDSATTKKWAEGYVERFKKAKEDSSFVGIHRSEVAFNPNYVARGSFPEGVDEAIFTSDSGTVIGPIYANGKYSLYKVSDIGEDSLPSVQARHILIPVLGSSANDTAEALSKANELMSKLRSGSANFAEEARSNFDGSGANGGSLGWIRAEGFSRLEEDLKNKILSRSNGSMFIHEGRDGIHVVEITSDRSFKTARVAVLEQSISAGNDTDREAERLAAEILYQAENNENFEEVVEAKGMSLRQGAKISEENGVIPGIQDPKQIIRWLYESERKVGDVSDVIDLNDRYVVAKVTAIAEEGTMKVEDAGDFARLRYIQSEKAKVITRQMEEKLASAGSIEKLAEQLNTAMLTIPAQTFASTSITSIGPDPKMLGVLFGLNEGEVSEPVPGDNGVYVLKVNGEVGQTGELNIDGAKMAAEADLLGRVDAGVFEALKAAGNIKDNRYKFF